MFCPTLTKCVIINRKRQKRKYIDCNFPCVIVLVPDTVWYLDKENENTILWINYGDAIKSAVNCGRQLFMIVDNKIKFRRENIMEFLEKLDAETLKTELLAFLDVGEENVEITTLGEFEEQFVEYIKDDFSRSKG